MNGVLLDTSYLITLSNPLRDNHLIAKQYFTQLINRSVMLYLSTIVISEFEVKQRVKDIGLQNFIVLPFNIDHAIAAASLTMSAVKTRGIDYPRCSVKDDVKLLAQCEIAGISHFLTDDEKCTTQIETLRKIYNPRKLPFGIYCGDKFTDAWFNPENQTSLIELTSH
jgi:predicted nucleic acid-binding protein